MQSSDIQGVALVVGAGSGIGRQVALTLASREVTTLICADINLQAAKETAEISQSVQKSSAKFEAECYEVDVREEPSVEDLISRIQTAHGRLDILVNTAGFGAAKQTPIRDMTLDDYNGLNSVHNIGSFLLLRAVLRVMDQQKEIVMSGERRVRGSIVILTSLASEGSFLGVGNYIAAKHAVKGLVQTAALENAAKGIRVNAVAPSYVSGPMMDKFLEEAPEVKKTMLGDLPIGRLVSPQEVADAVVFLASGSSSYINGHTLVVDGGASLALSNTPFGS